jgi:hypothetical protein
MIVAPKKNKPIYIIPEGVSLSGVGVVQGACAPGSQYITGNCKQGGDAGNNCLPGLVAGNNCNSGSNGR